jgi:hypothetical protein
MQACPTKPARSGQAGFSAGARSNGVGGKIVNRGLVKMVLGKCIPDIIFWQARVGNFMNGCTFWQTGNV